MIVSGAVDRRPVMARDADQLSILQRGGRERAPVRKHVEVFAVKGDVDDGIEAAQNTVVVWRIRRNAVDVRRRACRPWVFRPATT